MATRRQAKCQAGAAVTLSVKRWSSAAAVTGSKRDVVRVGCASGFWGDTAVAAPQLVRSGEIDYLVFDYLSEITMSLLARMRERNHALGYCPDFVRTMEPLLPELRERGVRVIANAGGVNPLACAAALQEVARASGVPLRIAAVTGDDVLPRLVSLTDGAAEVREMFTGKPLPELSSLRSVNAYLGAAPIVRALERGADIVVTGRCVDSACTLAPMVHELGWGGADYDRLSAGSLAGHIVECGAQSTGGIFSDWASTADGWSTMGFPVVDMRRDGSFRVRKPEGTGGKVSVGTVCEQLVYEIGDPAAYHLPDVTADWTQVRVRQAGPDVVAVSGARGSAPSDTFKVSATYSDGYRVTALAPVFGPDAAAKARHTGRAILQRCSGIFRALGLGEFQETCVHALGSGEAHTGRANAHPSEVTLWLAATHSNKRALQLMCGEIAPAATGMAPGITALPGGRPKVSPVFRLFSFLLPKGSLPEPRVHLAVSGCDGSAEDDAEANAAFLRGEEVSRESSWLTTRLADDAVSSDVDGAESGVSSADVDVSGVLADVQAGGRVLPLSALAWTRSGDKGNHGNVGIVARHPAFFPILKRHITAAAVAAHFAHVFDGAEAGADPRDLASRVRVYELPGICALNVMLLDSLGGGGVASLRPDPQGKAYGQHMSTLEIAATA